jgi:hypothetical protein
VPLIKYDFNRVTDRRRELRTEAYEVYFRDSSSGGDGVRWLSSKPHGKN